MNRYKVFSLTEAVKEGYPEADSFYDDGDGDWRGLLYELDDEGNPVRLVASDGGEPEDQSFHRDWSWVVDELNRAAKTSVS